MASTPSTLTDFHSELAIDASVLINLLGSGEAEAVLAVLKRPVLVSAIAYSEVKLDPLTRLSAIEPLNRLESQGLLSICELNSLAIRHMVALVGAPGSDALDDGEAATIALGFQRGCCVVIDEKRGRRIAEAIPVARGVLGTMDILAADIVCDALGPKRFKAAILNAARAARMRFPVEWGQWTENLLGEEVAKSFPGLRAYYRARK